MSKTYSLTRCNFHRLNLLIKVPTLTDYSHNGPVPNHRTWASFACKVSNYDDTVSLLLSKNFPNQLAIVGKFMCSRNLDDCK